jgi:thioredoxin-like negative regulator of GroEL
VPESDLHRHQSSDTTRDLAMEQWKARGRELNELYDIIRAGAGHSQTSSARLDLANIIVERDRLRAAARHLIQAYMADAGGWLKALNELEDAAGLSQQGGS